MVRKSPSALLVASVLAVVLMGTGSWLAALQPWGAERTAHSRATTPVPGPAITRYVALGDSYTAAPLVPDLVPGSSCFRSTNNYPALVARGTRVGSLVDRSCSGATIADLRHPQMEGVPAQFSALDAGTDLVTLSMGGNDSDVFGLLVGFCPSLRAQDPRGAPCRDRFRDDGHDDLLEAVDDTRRRLVAAVRTIHERAPGAQVLVVGYPQIVPRRGTCAALPLARGDYRYVRRVNRRLAEALRYAAARGRAQYVDVWLASRGHDICSAEPWVNGARTDPSRAQAYHPFAIEQRAIADLILDRLP